MSFSRLLVHIFLPHHTNNHRSKALHLDSLLTYVLIFALFNFSFRVLHRQMPDILGYATDIHVEQLLSGTNAQRQSAGLSSLVLNQELSQAAAQKAQDMFAKNYWAHNSPSGATPWDFINASGYRYVIAGENLAKNFTTSQAVVDAWMASSSHKANIVKSSYQDVGFAVVNGILNGEETTLVVQIFGSSANALAAKPPQESAPVVIPEKSVETNAAPAQQTLTPPPAIAQAPEAPIFKSQFLGVTIKPAINIPTLTRDIVFVFAGVLLGILLIDAWVVSRKKIVRVAGHNIAHFFFLSAIVIAASLVERGSLL